MTTTMTETIIRDSQWHAAYQHFRGIYELYESLVMIPGSNTRYALEHVFQPIRVRYDAGERSQDLYDDMIGAV